MAYWASCTGCGTGRVRVPNKVAAPQSYYVAGGPSPGWYVVQARVRATCTECCRAAQGKRDEKAERYFRQTGLPLPRYRQPRSHKHHDRYRRMGAYHDEVRI